MDFMDAKILELRREQERTKLSGLEDGVVIKGVPLIFETCELFDGKMSIMLPMSFVDMPLKLAKIKYPSEQRPQVIKTDLLGSTNFAFNFFQKPILPNQLKEVADGFQGTIRKVNPANVFYESVEEQLGDLPICWFDFKGHAIDEQTYNVVYLTIIGKCLLHGIFNCTLEDMDHWKTPAFDVIRSIEDMTRRKENA